MSTELGYQLLPCGATSGQCIYFTQLEFEIADVAAQGVMVDHATLTLEGTSDELIEVTENEFLIPGGALRFVLSASVDEMPVRLVGYNKAEVHGALDSGAVSIEGLRFGHDNGDFSAWVQLDVEAFGLEEPPTATLAVLQEPESCDEPVLFAAETVDGDAIVAEHWWTGGTHSSGSQFRAVLAAGEHVLSFLAADETKRTAATAMRYHRTCR